MTDRGFYIRWLIGGIVMLLIVAGVCYLWYRHDTAPERKAAADAEEFARQWEKDQKAKPKRSAETEQATDGTPAESDMQSAEKLTTDKTEPSQAGTPAQNAETADVPVSPHGFGPYPEVPKDYPYSAHWDKDNPRFELLTRVRIKLWTQGINAEGVTYGRGGLIYPVIRGVVYVTRSGDGNISIPLSHPGDDLGVFNAYWDAETPEEVAAALDREMEGFTIDDLPAGLTAVDYEDAGIDPYQFLDLPRR